MMLTRASRFSSLKRWALEVARRRGMKRAKVALARKLATVLHRMWVDGTELPLGQGGRRRSMIGYEGGSFGAGPTAFCSPEVPSPGRGAGEAGESGQWPPSEARTTRS